MQGKGDSMKRDSRFEAVFNMGPCCPLACISRHMLAVLSNYEACLRHRRNRDVKAWAEIVSLVLLTLDELSIAEVCSAYQRVAAPQVRAWPRTHVVSSLHATLARIGHTVASVLAGILHDGGAARGPRVADGCAQARRATADEDWARQRLRFRAPGTVKRFDFYSSCPPLLPPLYNCHGHAPPGLGAAAAAAAGLELLRWRVASSSSMAAICSRSRVRYSASDMGRMGAWSIRHMRVHHVASVVPSAEAGGDVVGDGSGGARASRIARTRAASAQARAESTASAVVPSARAPMAADLLRPAAAAHENTHAPLASAREREARGTGGGGQ